MRAAIYARKSTDQTGVNEEDKSVTRQIAHATVYAAKKGWTVADNHIYVDDGVSGAEFVKRPGFLRLMNALKPRPDFQVLIMSEESRLGREQIQTAYALQQITDAGVRVFYYLTDQERTLHTAMDKMMVSLTNFGAEMEREKASQRTHDAMMRKALAGHVVGGGIYGYDNQEVKGTDGQRLHVIRVVNREEAPVVVRIFERYLASECGLTTIAKDLNMQGVPPPMGKGKGWCPSCIREMLRRPLYRGQIVWNQSQAIHRNGTQTSRKRPKAEWITLDAPDLRIVPEHLWERVQAKIARVGALYTRTPDGHRLLRSPNGATFPSPYLLSGIAQCGTCGGSIVAQRRGSKHGRDVYMCIHHHKRGPTVCANDLRIDQGILNSALLHGLASVLDDQMIAEAVKRALLDIRNGQTKFPTQRLALERQLSLVEARLRHFVELAATGRLTDSAYAEMVKEEAAKKSLAVQLEDLDNLMRMASLDGKRIEQRLRGYVANLKGVLNANTPQTRLALQRLIQGRVVCTLFDDHRGRGYAVTATGSYVGLLGEGTVVNASGGGQGS
ncbi:MAG: recombinase family protein [Nitrospirae bacterium]|nr:recombinase family protein [Nitrospirota bacterium]